MDTVIVSNIITFNYLPVAWQVSQFACLIGYDFKIGISNRSSIQIDYLAAVHG